MQIHVGLTYEYLQMVCWKLQIHVGLTYVMSHKLF